jgi:hypothetical protein
MPKRKTTTPPADRAPGQRSANFSPYIRILPHFYSLFPDKAAAWRTFVASQPLAGIARDTIIGAIVNLDWTIEPVDPRQRDELKSEVQYYTDLFSYNGEYDFTEFVEFIGGDYLDLPFGSGTELIREGDDPDGKLLHYIPLDGGTLFPTLNSSYPVGQEVASKRVYFPYYAINRIKMSPRREFEREGWGMAPPEKIYLFIELLKLGDRYYSKLLTDTPEAGLLDLMDMSEESAQDWIEAFQELMTGIDPFKIPVLYEHDKEAKFLPFGHPPTDIQFGEITNKYAALIAGGYGISLSDMGIQVAANGGETLAGSIRQERSSRRRGIGLAKKKINLFYNRMLPETVRFKWIDPDEEQSVATGRSRLATFTAFTQAIDKRMITPNEARQQAMADGLFTISMPEELPENEYPDELLNPGANTQPSLLGTKVPASQGGQGEVRLSLMVGDAIREYLNYDRIQSFVGSFEIDDPKEVIQVLDNSGLLIPKASEFDWLPEYHFYHDVFNPRLEARKSRIPFIQVLRQRELLENEDALRLDFVENAKLAIEGGLEYAHDRAVELLENALSEEVTDDIIVSLDAAFSAIAESVQNSLEHSMQSLGE